ATERVFVDGAPDVVAQNHAFGGPRRVFVTQIAAADRLDHVVVVVDSATVSRYFDHLATEADVRDAKATAHQPCATEGAFDLFRRRVRRDVEVLRRDAEQHVPHAAADEIGFEAPIAEPLNDSHGGSVDQAYGNAVLVALHRQELRVALDLAGSV